MTEHPLKIAVVGTPGGWSSERLADALEERCGFRLLIDLKELVFDLERLKVSFRGLDLSKLDALVIKKLDPIYSPELLDRLELLRFLKEQGLAIFSDPSHIGQMLNRLSCTLRLRSGQIPMPPTLATENLAEAQRAIEGYGEAVLKPLFSTKARGMKLIQQGDDIPAALAEFRAAGHKIIYVQKKLELPGRDLGIAFLGGRYLGSYARVQGAGAWSTTINEGGHYAPYEPPTEIITLAERAQALFGLDFCSVDVVETPEGPMVFEVSAFGGFRGLYKGAGIDAAERLAEHLASSLERTT